MNISSTARLILALVAAPAITLISAHLQPLQAATVPGVPKVGTAPAEESAAPLPDRLTSEQVDDLVARLSDEEVRALLIRQLDKGAAAAGELEDDEAMIGEFMNGLQRIEDRMRGIVSALSDTSQFRGVLWSRITAGSDASTWSVWLKIFLFFGVGAIAELLFRRSVASLGKLPDPGTPMEFGTKLKLSILRSAISGVAILVFALGAALAWLISDLPTDNARLLFSTLLTGIVAWRAVAVGSRLILAPRTPQLRLVELDDAAARGAHFKLMLVVTVLIFLVWLSGELMRGYGIDQDVRGAIGIIDSAIWIAVVIGVIWSLRPRRGSGGADPDTSDYYGRNWHVIAIVGTLLIYVLALGVNLATDTRTLGPAIASLIVLGLLPILDMALRRAVGHFMTVTADTAKPASEELQIDTSQPDFAEHMGDEEPEARKGALEEGQSPAPVRSGGRKSYESVVTNNIRILLFLFALFAFAEIWDLNLFGLLQALFGPRTTSVIVNFSITALLAYALWGIVSTAVERIAGPEGEADLSGDEGGGEGSRMGTVLPLFKKFLLITLIIMLVLIFLSSLGVDIGPLIAGAGIVGIAIGFGAQTLVKDIVSGLFFLLDDAFRVGEYVTIGDTKGTVEKISVRSLRLRHHNGPLHTVPFGEITTLTNWSRDWAIMKFEIRVPFETDVDLVRRIIKKVGQAMLEDEELGPMFLEPLKSQGVNRMDDSSFIIRCKFTCKPGNQFYMRREAFARIQAAFEAKGIKFAPKRVIVETATPSIPPAVAAAAAAADSQNDEPPVDVADEPG